MLNHSRKAIKEFKELIKVNPNCVKAHLSWSSMGAAYGSLGYKSAMMMSAMNIDHKIIKEYVMEEGKRNKIQLGFSWQIQSS